MKIAVIAYGSGNIRSVQFALQRAGASALVTDDEEELRSADKIIFPGVGEASSAMQELKKRGLDKLIPQLQQPVLGICLGMQLLCRHSEEGDTPGLGIFETGVKKFPASDLKIPEIGWNTISGLRGKLFKGIPENEYVYYVHSYYAEICENTTAVTKYIVPYSAGLEKNNFYAVQSHPEKSGIAGEFIIRNFLDL